jgi:hypothetical protein
VVVQQGSLVYVFIGDGNWHRFNLDRLGEAALESTRRESGALLNSQEVES